MKKESRKHKIKRRLYDIGEAGIITGIAGVSSYPLVARIPVLAGEMPLIMIPISAGLAGTAYAIEKLEKRKEQKLKKVI